MSQRKSDGNDLIFSGKDKFAREACEYGYYWVDYDLGKLNEEDKDYPERRRHLPTPRQLLDGLKMLMEHIIRKQIGNQREFRVKKVMQTYTNVFKKIEQIMDFPDMNQKFYGLYDNDEMDPIYGLFNPRSRASVLVLWLYSVEPPLYFHLNDACRSMDHPLIPMLGPFARAIYETLSYAE